jgi:hypothetical protein
MSASNNSTEVRSFSGQEIRAEKTATRADSTTTATSGSARVVVTRQQSGEVKLRFAPRHVPQVECGSTTVE